MSMPKINRAYSGPLSLAVFDAIADRFPRAAADVIEIAWRGSMRPVGSFDRWAELPLSLLDVVRLKAIDERMSPLVFADLVESAPGAEEADLDAIWAAGTVALRDAPLLRWIGRNPQRVAGSENWRTVLPGLGGLTVSVPLAEVALLRVTKSRGRLPRDVTAFVQLNPWFSPWFVSRFRRYHRGKRIRVRNRGATARAWSHARTLLGHRVPFEWSTMHGRGVGRPLDHWSERFLGMYLEAFDRAYEGAVPAPVASLYAISRGALGRQEERPNIAGSWDALPQLVEDAGRTMLGITNEEHDTRDRDGLIEAAARFGQSDELWGEFVQGAFAERRGVARTAQELVV